MNSRQLAAIFGLVLCGGCMTTLGDRSMMGTRQPDIASPYLGSFDRLWSDRTIFLTQSEGHGGSSLQSGGEESSREGSGPFPILVRATYMDSVLVNAGLRAFGDLASMSEGERSLFSSNYRKARGPGDSVFIWVEMQTSSTEDFLQLDRWTIYLENEVGAQIEPGRIVEHPTERHQAPQGTDEVRGKGRESSPAGATVVKEVELYFRRIPAVTGNLTVGAARTLRLVMFETKNPLIRAEASWQITASSVSRGGK